MTPLTDEAVAHLRTTLDLPELPAARYRDVQHLADGGMGRVYRAEDVALGRPVAIKVVHTGRADPQSAARMLREARVIAGLEHPGIVPVHDVGTLPDGRAYYVMKLVEGARLDEYCAQHPDRAAHLRIFERLCETVAFAHAHGVIHRDLKPQNIMVGEFGEVLVLDWGIARILAAADELAVPPGTGGHVQGPSRSAADAPTRTRLTAHGAVIGTIGYMAPEQARGELDRVDARSDVYALGAILYFLLVGRPPTDSAAFERLQDGLPHMPERPRRIRADIPRPLEAICLAALAPEPADRYPSAAALAADVSQHLAGRLPAVYRERLLERVRRLAWTYRTPVVLVVAYLLMRAALLLWRSP